MKINAILLFIIIILLQACNELSSPPLVLNSSESTLFFGGGAKSLKVYITGNVPWVISGMTTWCTVDTTSGEGTTLVTVSVESNSETEERTTQLIISSSKKQIQIPIDIIQGTSRQLPVIFHVLYENREDTLQNITNNAITNLVENCNLVYSNYGGNSIDMELGLSLAKYDPSGKKLSEPGVNRIKYHDSARLDCNLFMESKLDSYIPTLWDPNEYVNVYVYNFTDSTTLGISHLPFTTTENGLPGLDGNDYYFTNPMQQIYCISLNSRYVYDTAYNIRIALPHELGHYLGLFHVFSEQDCSGNDWCDDTPNYNRREYERWRRNNNELPLDSLMKRTDCNGVTFTSVNIMDYDYSFMDRFTQNQYNRIQHVLRNSPLIPGTRRAETETKSVKDNVAPPRIRFMP